MPVAGINSVRQALLLLFITLLSFATSTLAGMSATVDQPSFHQLKSALKALSIDTSDCIEKSDFHAKLRRAEADGHDVAAALASVKLTTAASDLPIIVDFSGAVPKYYTLKSNYDGSVVTYESSPTIIGNTVNPTALVTLTHGFGDTADGWKDTARMLHQNLPHVLFMLPTAPRQPITVSGGSKVSAWFDIMQMGGPHMTIQQLANRPTDVNGVLTSARYISHMAGYVAHKHKIPTNRIVFAGFSQGAAISIAAGLLAPYVPRAVMPLSGFFPAIQTVLADATASGQLEKLTAAKVPFTLFHGDNDNMLPLPLAKLSLDALVNAGVDATIKVYEGMAHTTTSKEMSDIVAFLKSVTE